MEELFEYSLPFNIVDCAAESLSHQCLSLNMTVRHIPLAFKMKSELIGLRYFEKKGYEGSHCEGKYIFSIIHALILDGLELHNKAKSPNRKLAARRPLKEQLLELQGLHDLVFEDILTANHVQFRNNLEEILSERQSFNGYPEAYIEFAQRIMGHISRELLQEIAYALASDNKLFRGWPDLIVVNDDELLLVEVKCNDNLTVSQLYTLYHLKKWFSNVEIAKLDECLGRIELRRYQWFMRKMKESQPNNQKPPHGL